MPPNTYFAYRSFWPEWETMKRFGDCDINEICFFPSNTVNSLGEPYCKYPPIWLWFDQYDFAPLDRQIADLVKANPKAEFICIVDLNTPLWLARQLSVDSFHQLSRAVCMPRWREEMHKYLEAFLKYAEERYGDRIKAYVLASGQTDEWMDYNGTAVCAAKEQAYLNWCGENGQPVPVGTPSFPLADSAAFDGCLYDPASPNSPVNYWKFNSWIIADVIVQFAEKARSLIRPEAEIGAFYGYIMELDVNRLVKCGHLAYEHLLQSLAIDFTISPGAYGARDMGEGSGFMVPHGTVERFGKRHLHECDQRTHTYNNKMTEFVTYNVQKWRNETEDIAGMKREMALALINRASLWWFDMWGGFYQEKKTYENLEQMKRIWDAFSPVRTETVAEIALVVDPQSCFMLNDASFMYRANMHFRNLLNQCGAPFEVYSFNDLPELDNLHRYKFIIFPCCFEIDEKKAGILETSVFNNDRTIFWLYAPGISDGKNIDAARVKEWSGTDFKTPGLSHRNMGCWQSVYGYDYREIGVDALREIAIEAGVHVYTGSSEVVYANDKLLAVHTAVGGEKTITLPKIYKEVTELYSGKTVAVDADSFRYMFDQPDTALFELK